MDAKRIMKKQDNWNVCLGFTLVELLVVISIICVLAAILFPVFARARENARRASCMSNMKQIALGIRMYTQDFDERFPQYPAAGSGDVQWAPKVYPYVNNIQIYRCPSAPQNKGTAVWPSTTYATYGMNGNTTTGLYQYTGVSLASIGSPAVTWMLVELGHPVYYYSLGYGYPYFNPSGYVKTDGSTSGTSTPESITYWLAYKTTDSPNGHPAHLGGSNIAYVDGHVKWRKEGASLVGQNWKASSPTYGW